jgi:prepilin-type N-terminal cleavage/methylation domain-containing protein
MEFKTSDRKAARRAFSLPELLVATAIGSIMLLFAGSFYAFSMRSFTSMANYTDLNLKSRNASDLISRDLRSALSVQSLNNNQLVLNGPGGTTNITYTYDAVRGTLSRGDGTSTRVLLTQIATNSFAFCFYGRPAGSIYESFPTNSPNGAKIVGFKWSCTRPVMAGSAASSESLQMALVNLRNQ